MRTILLVFAFLLSTPLSAATYDCLVKKEQLGPDAEVDLPFALVTREDQSASLTMFGDLVSDACVQVSIDIYECEDEEYMPYKLEIQSKDVIYLSVGMIVDRLPADCSMSASE